MSLVLWESSAGFLFLYATSRWLAKPLFARIVRCLHPEHRDRFQLHDHFFRGGLSGAFSRLRRQHETGKVGCPCKEARIMVQ